MSSLTCFSCHFYLSSQGNQFTMCLFVSSSLPAAKWREKQREREREREEEGKTCQFLSPNSLALVTTILPQLPLSLFPFTFLPIFKHFCSYACFTSYLFDCPTGGQPWQKGRQLSRTLSLSLAFNWQLSSGVCVYVCTAATPQCSPFSAAKSCVLNPQVMCFPFPFPPLQHPYHHQTPCRRRRLSLAKFNQILY